jgi:hypothetical protein
MLNKSKPRPVFLLITASFIAVVLLSASLTTWLNEHELEQISSGRITTTLSRDQKPEGMHNGVYFEELANRLQYHPHDPAQIANLYRIAILKEPADYRGYLAYGNYLASRMDMKHEAVAILIQTVNRSPMSAPLSQEVGAALIRIGERNLGEYYLRRSKNLGRFNFFQEGE